VTREVTRYSVYFSGGVLSNSLALFTDVLHLASDLISFLISLLAMYLSKKPATRTMSFGFHRAGRFVVFLNTGEVCVPGMKNEGILD